MRHNNVIAEQTRKRLGVRLSLLRNTKGISQAQLAALVSTYCSRRRCYSPLTISSWETGRRAMPDDAFWAIVDLFGISPDFLDQIASTKVIALTPRKVLSSKPSRRFYLVFHEENDLNGEYVYAPDNHVFLPLMPPDKLYSVPFEDMNIRYRVYARNPKA